MRLDLFLKASRLCLRRTIAQKLCEAGRVTLNGHTAKSSSTVKVGDEIAITRRDRIVTVRVLAVPALKQTSKKEATELYEVLRVEILEAD